MTHGRTIFDQAIAEVTKILRMPKIEFGHLACEAGVKTN